VSQDYSEAARWFSEAAKGFPKAKYALGVCYRDGQGVPQDHSEAVKWFRKGADQWRLPRAQYALGVCYRDGRGVPKDYSEAVKWFRKAADQGDAQAQYSLAIHYIRGDGVSKDIDEAASWLQKATDNGCKTTVEVAKYLAACYNEGVGVLRDEIKAAKWFRVAADQGDADAQHALASCYRKGIGVTRDFREALKLDRKAAEQGNREAQVALGVSYELGFAVPEDYIEVYMWYNLAATQGETNAFLARFVLSKKMTPAQIAESQRLSREFKPRIAPESGPTTSDRSSADSNPSATGTGFFITEDGFLVSNEHVIRDATQVRLVTRAGIVSAKVVRVDTANDLALLKADGQFAPLPIAASRAVRLGGTVSTVGFPNIGLQGFAPKLAKGEIASLSGAQDNPRYFQISVPLQPGNSGGALVDDRGNVVGVVSAKLDAAAALAATGTLPENVNYAVKSGFLLIFLESVPEVSAKVKEPETKDRKFEDVVRSAEQAAVVVLVY